MLRRPLPLHARVLRVDTKGRVEIVSLLLVGRWFRLLDKRKERRGFVFLVLVVS